MRRNGTGIDRRQFLRQSAALGLGTLFAPALASKACTYRTFTEKADRSQRRALLITVGLIPCGLLR